MVYMHPFKKYMCVCINLHTEKVYTKCKDIKCQIADKVPQMFKNILHLFFVFGKCSKVTPRSVVRGHFWLAQGTILVAEDQT